MYIHERDNWTAFRWDASSITGLLEDVSRKQGLLYGRLSSLGFDSKLRAMAENLTYDVVYSSEIEGIRLNVDEVRSSIARKLGIENVKQTAPSRYINSVVAVMLDAMGHYDQKLTKETLCAWQAALFPTGYSEGTAIKTEKYRTTEEHVVSGFFGREKIHYIAPSPDRVEVKLFVGAFVSYCSLCKHNCTLFLGISFYLASMSLCLAIVVDADKEDVTVALS